MSHHLKVLCCRVPSNALPTSSRCEPVMPPRVSWMRMYAVMASLSFGSREERQQRSSKACTASWISVHLLETSRPWASRKVFRAEKKAVLMRDSSLQCHSRLLAHATHPQSWTRAGLHNAMALLLVMC